jgi:hypothetical protein
MVSGVHLALQPPTVADIPFPRVGDLVMASKTSRCDVGVDVPPPGSCRRRSHHSAS